MRTLGEVRAVGCFLAGFAGPWWVAGGWALDLWRGTISRDHEDIEISVLRRDQELLYAYCAEWPRYTPRDDLWEPMLPGEELLFPEFQVQVRPPPSATVVYPGLPPEFEFMLNNVEDGAWIFRPAPHIRRAWDRAVLPGAYGLRVTAPELLLLHKARHHRPKDEHDFAQVHPYLAPDQRAWLRAALRALRPADPWLASLDDPAGPAETL